ncbi:alpha/beta hydrolase [Clostridium sp. MB05]|uniref:alpha/beta hydrolase n=1 Tax=Clostridium sp. MB05 TaxID=3376682 RepID=UPI003982B88A
MKKKKSKKIILIICIILSVVILISVAMVSISSKVTALVTKQMFEKQILTKPINYDEYIEKVKSFKDLSYESKYKNNNYDVYMPKDINEKLYPAIIWIHGGAYVEGDKKYTETFSTMLASYGFIVLSINYELVPEAKYPTPIKQVEEFYNHIINVKSEYSIDETKLFFAGDSAGAQIASQFIAVQTNKELAKNMEIQQTVPLNSIKGTLLYCGPYDVNLLGNSEGNYLFKFLLNQSTWNYIGGRNLKNSQEAREFSVVDNITEDFPPSFITDGNTNSFENHAKELIKTLKEKNVEVEELLFSKDQYITEHDYQFILNTEAANIAFNNTINFLKQHIND